MLALASFCQGLFLSLYRFSKVSTSKLRQESRVFWFSVPMFSRELAFRMQFLNWPLRHFSQEQINLLQYIFPSGWQATILKALEPFRRIPFLSGLNSLSTTTSQVLVESYYCNNIPKYRKITYLSFFLKLRWTCDVIHLNVYNTQSDPEFVSNSHILIHSWINGL